MSIGNNGRVQAAKAVHVREFDGEMVLLDLERGEYYGLDEMGCLMWKGLSAGETPTEIVSRLAPEHEVEPERMLADLVALADELVRRGLAVPR